MLRRRRSTTLPAASAAGRLVLALTLAAAVVPGAASALSLRIAPADQTVDVGADVSVDVEVVSPAGVGIGAYDLVVAFDPAVLDLQGVDFAAGLGGPGDSLQEVVLSTGMAAVVEASLLGTLPQDGTSDLVLFTLRFEALAPGATFLELTPGSTPPEDSLSDASGFAVMPTAILSGRVVVVAAEPGLLGLSLALGGLAFLRRSPRSRGATR